MSPDFRVAKRVIQGPFLLANEPEERLLPLLREFYEPLTPYNKAVLHALFAATDNEHPEGWQQAKPSDLLALVHDAVGDKLDITQQQRQDLMAAIQELRRRTIPLAQVTIERRGRYYVKQLHIRDVSLLQGFGLVYRDRETGEELHPQEDHRLRHERRPVKVKGFDRHEGEARKGRRRRGQPAPDEENAMLATLFKLPRNSRWIGPVAFEFRWGSDILEDLQMKPATDAKGNVLRDRSGHVLRQGIGFIRLQRNIFAVLKRLRDDHQPTAARLFELVASDILGKDVSGQLLEKEAKRVFQLLGFPEPGSVKPASRARQDGRWAENVERVAEAVRALKAEGVLEPESDEEPRIDPNPNRRKAGYYRWKRSAEFTPTFCILDDEDADRIGATLNAATPATKPLSAPKAALPAPEPTFIEPDLFGRVPTASPRGRDIRAAREAAGMDLRAFAQRFGRSIYFWSEVENEVLSGRTGEPKAVPAEVREEVAAFLRDYLDEGGKA
jgi:hypothetical protein